MSKTSRSTLEAVQRAEKEIGGPVRRLYHLAVPPAAFTAVVGVLGKTGLAGALPPYANALAPTAAELRRAAIYNSYVAIVDMTPGGGYGSLYGPNVDADGAVTASEGKVAGSHRVPWRAMHHGPRHGGPASVRDGRHGDRRSAD